MHTFVLFQTVLHPVITPTPSLPLKEANPPFQSHFSRLSPIITTHCLGFKHKLLCALACFSTDGAHLDRTGNSLLQEMVFDI